MIVEFDTCYDCPYHEGGEMMNAMYCGFFDPPRQIFDMNGHKVQFKKGTEIAWFCELPDNEVFNGVA